MLVYMCACRLRLCVRSGLRIRLTHHLSRPPPPPPCSDGGGCRRCVGDFSRRGRMLGRAPAPLSAVDWRGLALLALLGPDWGVGGLWVSGPRARSALVWSAAGGACGLAATAPWGAYTVAVGGPAFGLSSALSGWRPRLSLRWFSWGSRALGGLRMFGARVFSVPASCLAGWGCCSPHTLLNVYMEEPYEHKRAPHTGVHSSIHIGVKNRCSQTPIVLICCCFKTYFVILVMCAAQ